MSSPLVDVFLIPRLCPYWKLCSSLYYACGKLIHRLISSTCIIAC
jgi:hypothetical protein